MFNCVVRKVLDKRYLLSHKIAYESLIFCQKFSKNYVGTTNQSLLLNASNKVKLHHKIDLLSKKLYFNVRHFTTSSTDSDRRVERLASCWNCSAQITDLFFCSQCGKVQPPPDVLTVESREVSTTGEKTLTYFDLFEMEPSFEVDLSTMKQKYRDLQSQLHPDKFATADAKEQEFSRELSSMLNDSLSVIQSPYLRAKYLAKITFNNATNSEERSSAEDEISHSTEFLMTIMEWNEILEEQEGQDLEKLQSKLTDTRNETLEELRKGFKALNADAVRENIAKLKYFDNLSEKLKFKVD